MGGGSKACKAEQCTQLPKLRPRKTECEGNPGKPCAWGVAQTRGTLLGVPIIGIIASWGLYWGSLRWILKNLHDPTHLVPWELWCYSILRTCRIFSINSNWELITWRYGQDPNSHGTIAYEGCVFVSTINCGPNPNP